MSRGTFSQVNKIVGKSVRSILTFHPSDGISYVDFVRSDVNLGVVLVDEIFVS